MGEGHTVDSKLTEKEQSIQEEFKKSERELDGLKGDLQGIDTELGELAQRNHQYELLSTVCRSLDELENLGASRLFWASTVALTIQPNTYATRGACSMNSMRKSLA